MDSKQKSGKRRLERRNAVKNIDYDLLSSSSPDDSTSLCIRSLDGQTSFRVGGIAGEIEQICRSLGLSGPEDFAIPVAAWEARKARSSSDLHPRSRLHHLDITNSSETEEPSYRKEEKEAEEETDDTLADFSVRVRDGNDFAKLNKFESSEARVSPSGGIKGVRPPVLAPPPSMSLPVIDMMSSTWTIFKSLAPEDNGVSSSFSRKDSSSDSDGEGSVEEDENVEEDARLEEQVGARLGETADLTGCSSSTSNDDDSSSTTTETMFIISPNGRFKRNIKSWMRGGLLGSGSFGTVYEGISDDGFFFAVKEVSLLDQGSRAQQCIDQLEQEIQLLSQFEHDNIVQYFGTDKEEAKLYIFLQLVTQGSLASLYQRYNLRDSQVCAYTRQILNGLKYLHDQNVMHRDIKCANILVDASGSVKLADFGLAKETSKLNVLKSCKGSAYWMAPEVVNPRKTYRLKADIWSFGCTVLEMFTRQVPYSNLEWTQALFKIGRGEPPPIPSSLSKDARDFIHQCLQVNPDDRPSASELLDHPFVMRPLPASAGSVSPSNGG